MGKKFSKDFIQSKSLDFNNYLISRLDEETIFFIKTLNDNTHLYLFSGVIRDYFLEFKGDFRDLDFVYIGNSEHGLKKILNNYEVKQNSFGGYKIIIGNVNIDLWDVNKTWGFHNGQLYLDLNNEFFLPKTTFFNFSSIVFDLKNKRFIISDVFVKFLEKKELDIVYEYNPLPILCVVNTVYYSKKYDLKISKNLKKYYINYFEKYSEQEYRDIQIKHFGEIKFDYYDLKKFSIHWM